MVATQGDKEMAPCATHDCEVKYSMEVKHEIDCGGERDARVLLSTVHAGSDVWLMKANSKMRYVVNILRLSAYEMYLLPFTAPQQVHDGENKNK